VSEARWRFTTIAHTGRALLGPVSEASVDRLLARVPAHEPARVLDVGCGKGEWLVRALERLGGTGVGIEPNPEFAADARARAEARLGADRVRIEERDYSPALLGPERFSLVLCTGSLHAFGHWDAALAAVATLAREHGHALLAPAYWKRPPAREYLEFLGAAPETMHSLPDTIARAEAAGWRVTAAHGSTPAEWDDYEHAYAASVRAWCDAHPEDADAAGFEQRIERWVDAYERWGRATMGYALLLLERGPTSE